MERAAFFGPVHLKIIMTTTAVKSTGSAEFWIVPWLLILIIVVVLALAFWLWRRRRKKKLAEQDPTEAAAETAASLRRKPIRVPTEDEPATIS